MSYHDRPWLARYDRGQPADIQSEFDSALEMFAAAVAAAPDAPAIRYFDATLTVAELDALSDAFAVALLDGGMRQGDRVGLYLQNVPQFLIALLGTWKAGGIAVSINPMNKERELSLLLRDSGAAVLVCLEGLYESVASKVLADTEVRLAVTTSELEYQSRNDPRVFGGVQRLACEGAEDMAELLARL